MDFVWDSAWQWVQAHLPHFAFYFSPFWGLLLIGIGVCLVAFLLAWCFQIMRPVAGIVLLVVIAFLSGFWKGERARDDKRKADDAKAKKPAPKPDQWKRW